MTTDIHVGCGGEWLVSEARVDDQGVDLVLTCSTCGDVLLIPSPSADRRTR
jgi:hypothetical protein